MTTTSSLSIYRGQYKQFALLAKDPAGVGIDLTGLSLTLTVRTAVDGDIVVTKVSGDGITHGNQTTTPGAATIEFLEGDTIGLAPATLTYDLWLFDAQAHPVPLVPPSPFVVKSVVRDLGDPIPTGSNPPTLVTALEWEATQDAIVALQAAAAPGVAVPADGALTAVPTFAAPVIGHWSAENVVIVSNQIQTWTDLGPWGNDCTQGNAGARGRYHYDPSIRHYAAEGDGAAAFWSNAAMKGAGGVALPLFETVTAIVVARLYGFGASGNTIFCAADATGADNTQAELICLTSGSQIIWTTKNAGQAVSLPYPLAAVNPPVLDVTTRWNYYVCKHSPTQRSISLNGGAPIVKVGAEAPSAIKYFNIGRLVNFAGYYLKGAIARIILLGGDITPTEEANIGTFMRSSYGVTS